MAGTRDQSRNAPGLKPQHRGNSTYSSFPSSWTFPSSSHGPSHRQTLRREARGGCRGGVRARLCGTAQETWWGWSPQSWGCGWARCHAPPYGAHWGCWWGAGSTRSCCLPDDIEEGISVTYPSHLRETEHHGHLVTTNTQGQQTDAELGKHPLKTHCWFCHLELHSCITHARWFSKSWKH